MEFRIADTFTAALSRLTNEEQKAVKTTVFDLQLDPSGNGLRLHKLDRARDKNFWSVSASMDLRIIVHRQGDSLLLCYVNHHDKAYQWAASRKLEVHPNTGAAQLVEIVETVREIELPSPVADAKREDKTATVSSSIQRPLLLYTDEFLLQYGVPTAWLDPLRRATEDELLDLVDRLPGEAAEAVLDLAVGHIPPVPAPLAADIDPFEHPDALRRFRVIETEEELRVALEEPWDRWTIFLHPTQREMAGKDYSGPARVSGSAGTGKTVVALHRAAQLARRYEDARVLLTTFSDALANALLAKRNRLIAHEPRLGERIDVQSLDTVARRLYRARGGKAKLADWPEQRAYILEAAAEVEHSFPEHFLLKEWRDVVDPWQLRTWEAYRDVPRLGRKTQLREPQRRILWDIYRRVYDRLEQAGRTTMAGIFQYLADHFQPADRPSPYDFIIVDEAQDLGVPQLRLLAALGKDRPNSLFFAGDLGQRIFQAPFSWESLGVRVRGRSSTLRINYRTSHQIRRQADLLLSPEIADVDGNRESRRYAQSVFNGPPPELVRADTEAAEADLVGRWIQDRLAENVAPEEIAVFVRAAAQLDRARRAVAAAGQTVCELDERLYTQTGCVTLSTMHLAKGLEFRAVAVMACDQDVIPDAERLEAATDLDDIDEIYETERQLLYVACTRARDFLLLSCVGEGSEFLGDMGG